MKWTKINFPDDDLLGPLTEYETEHNGVVWRAFESIAYWQTTWDGGAHFYDNLDVISQKITGNENERAEIVE